MQFVVALFEATIADMARIVLECWNWCLKLQPLLFLLDESLLSTLFIFSCVVLKVVPKMLVKLLWLEQ